MAMSLPDRLVRWGGRLRHRDVLRGGYGAMILLLIFSALEAYRIQASASQQSVEIYRRYVREEDALYRFRRVLFLGGIAARDYLLNPAADRASVFRADLDRLKGDADGALDELDQMGVRSPSTLELRTQLREYWSTLESTLELREEANAAQTFDFVQNEVVPRRNATGALVRQLAEANQNALRNSEAEFASSRRFAARRLLVILGLCLLCGVAVAWASLAYSENLERERARHLREVEQAKGDLEQLSARLLEVQEDERRRLSRELHDEIGQMLTALRIEISHASALCQEAVRDRLERARSLAEKTVQTVRDISLLLRPSMLDDLGLGPALQWQLEDFSRRSGVPSEFDEERLEDDLPDAYKTCVYRVVQEALHNCQRHAGASRVRLSIHQETHQITVRMEDNGCGFEPDGRRRRPGSLGIVGMRERAALLGGTVELESAFGKGTRLTLRLPLTKAEAAPQAAGSRRARA